MQTARTRKNELKRTKCARGRAGSHQDCAEWNITQKPSPLARENFSSKKNAASGFKILSLGAFIYRIRRAAFNSPFAAAEAAKSAQLLFQKLVHLRGVKRALALFHHLAYEEAE